MHAFFFPTSLKLSPGLRDVLDVFLFLLAFFLRFSFLLCVTEFSFACNLQTCKNYQLLFYLFFFLVYPHITLSYFFFCDFSWQKKVSDNEFIPVSLNERVQQLMGVLSISNVQNSDGGTYACEASNSMGSVRFETGLVVTGKRISNLDQGILKMGR